MGSILAISDEAGNKLEQRHFDAWGNLTHLKIGNDATITDKNQIRNYLSNGNLIVDRGYTSHEHFAEVGLIHMNGRLYDPLLRRFLNADENIQDPHNTQNYNKYGYVMNNPLMYNDPGGEFLFLAALLGVSKFVAAIIGGALIGLASYSVGVLVTGQKWNIGAALKATFFGALGGAASFGVGEIFKVAAEVGKYATKFAQTIYDSVGGVGLAVVQAGTHAISQGVLGLMQGQSLASAALSGFAGSLASSGWISVVGTSGASMIAFGAIAGGIGAELSGGNFWQGALTGGIVAGLNHVAHQIDSPLADDGDGDGPGPKSQRPIIKRKVFPFSKTQRAYGLSEGLGIFAGYTIDGNIIVEGNNITVLASGSTTASSQNSVYFTGQVTISGTSEYALSSYSQTILLQKDYSRPFFTNADKFFIGQATFNLPSNIKNFNISIRAGYVFKNGDGLFSVPIPATTTYSRGFKR